jgi:hypothetical protein
MSLCWESWHLNSTPQKFYIIVRRWGKVNYDGFSTATERGVEELQEAKVPIINSEVCSSDKVSNEFGLRRHL